MARRDSGGRKTAHPLSVRERALKLAGVVGIARASAETGVKPGTIRSWRRRQFVRDALDEEASGDSAGLAAVKREGEAIVARREAQLAAGEEWVPAEPEDAGGAEPTEQPAVEAPPVKPKRRRRP